MPVLCLAAPCGWATGSTTSAIYRMPLYPLWPVAGLGALGYVLYTSALDPKLGQPSLLANGVVVLLAIAYYRLILRRKKDWVLTGPEDHGGP